MSFEPLDPNLSLKMCINCLKKKKLRGAASTGAVSGID